MDWLQYGLMMVVFIVFTVAFHNSLAEGVNKIIALLTQIEINTRKEYYRKDR
jgi:hypothetical protein